MDIPFDEMHAYLDGVLNAKFKKERKMAKKFIFAAAGEDIRTLKGYVKNLDAGISRDIHEDVESPAFGFMQDMAAEINNFEAMTGDDVTYEHMRVILDSWAALFKAFNKHGKKWFGNEFKTTLKHLQSALDKVKKNNDKFENFLNTKYEKVMEAEEIGDKLDELGELFQATIKNKEKISPLKKLCEELELKVEELVMGIEKLEDNDVSSREADLLREQNYIKQKIQSKLSKIKKSVKSFQKLIQDGRFTPRNITSKDVSEYFKKLFSSLVADGVKYPTFKIILENLISCLDGEIQMKSDKKAKAIAAIKSIKDEGSLEPLVKEYLDYEGKRGRLADDIRNSGITGEIERKKRELSSLKNKKNQTDDDLARAEKNAEKSDEALKSLKEKIEHELSILSGDEITIILH
ncbi:MAG: hypothetical protein ACTSUE_16060 [Promethearchaeota archaeon]